MKGSYLLILLVSLAFGGSCFQSSAESFHEFNNPAFNISNVVTPTINVFCPAAQHCHVCWMANFSVDCAKIDFPESFLTFLLQEDETERQDELLYIHPENKVESSFKNTSEFTSNESNLQGSIIEKEEICPVSKVTSFSKDEVNKEENMFFNSTCPASHDELKVQENTCPAVSFFKKHEKKENTCPANLTFKEQENTCPAVSFFKDYEKKEDTCPVKLTVKDYEVNTCRATDVFNVKQSICLIEEGPKSNT